MSRLARQIRRTVAPAAALLLVVFFGVACSDSLVDPESRRVSAEAVNKAPIALDDSVTIRLGEVVAINVLRNDSDPDGTLDVSGLSVSEPENGVVAAGNDSTVTYTPRADFVGRDGFSYTVKDDLGAVSGSARVSVIVVLGPPQPPELLEPSDGAVDVMVPVRLSWGPSPFVLEYNIQVSADEDFASPAFESIQPTREVDVELERSTTYFWRVRGINAIDAGSWSPVRRFTTISGPPGLPTLLSPANGAVGVSLEPELEWQALASAESYRVQVADNVAFAGALFDQTVSDSRTELTAGSLVAGRRYFWRVRGENRGGSGPWSPSWSFVTEVVPPPAPAPLEPADAAEQVSLTPVLHWARVDGADAYQVELADDLAFSSIVYSSSDSTAVRAVPSGRLEYETTYFWRVRAGNIAGFSPWSMVMRFTTAPPPPVSPELVSPANAASVASLVPVLTWSAVPGALEYRLQVAEDVTFGAPVLDRTLSDTTFAAPAGSLTSGTRYFWRVRSVNAGGLSGWSPTWFFDTPASE